MLRPVPNRKVKLRLALTLSGSYQPSISTTRLAAKGVRQFRCVVSAQAVSLDFCLPLLLLLFLSFFLKLNRREESFLLVVERPRSAYALGN